jgi:hypothetical protein
LDATVIALISTLVVSIIGNVAAWWQLANQAKKDKIQAGLDDQRLRMEKDKAEADKEAADIAASLTVAESLRVEIERLQKRGLELENTVIAKTTEIGELKLAAIDKEAELRTMKYQMQNLQMKYDSMIDIGSVNKKKVPATKKIIPSKMKPEVLVEDKTLSWNMDLVPAEEFSSDILQLAMDADEAKKTLISRDMDMEIEELRNNSISKELLSDEASRLTAE